MEVCCPYPRQAAAGGKKHGVRIRRVYLLCLLACLLTYALHGAEPYFQLVKKFPVFCRKIHYRIHNFPPSVHILSQLDPVHTSTSHFLKVYLNIILPSRPGSPNWSLFLTISHQNFVDTSPHVRYIPRPSHSSRFYHPNSIDSGVQIIKPLIMSVFSAREAYYAAEGSICGSDNL